jgi:hypothetical protein
VSPMNDPIIVGEWNQKLTIVNPGDRTRTRHRYVLWFGAYGWTRLMVWANSLDDALDEAVDWIVDHAPGLLCDDVVAEEYGRAIAAGMTPEAAQEEAEEDTTCAGNYGNRILSWEWGIVAENPSRAEVLEMLGRTR